MLSSDFHEGNLISISSQNGVFELHVLSRGKLIKITVKDLERLRVSDFKDGNVINFLRVFSGEEEMCNEGRYMSLIKYVYDIDDETVENDGKIPLALEKAGLMLMEMYGSPLAQQAQCRVQQGLHMAVPIGMSRILELESIQTGIREERKDEKFDISRS